MPLYINNDGLVTLTGLHNDQSGAYVNNATVTAQVYLDDYTTTVGSPITLSYVAASNGNYQGQIPNSLALTVGVMYSVRVTGTSGGLQFDDWCDVPATRRKT